MKKVFLLAITAGLAMSSFAQNKMTPGIKMTTKVGNAELLTNATQQTANKTTDGFDTTVIEIITDSTIFSHLGANDTLLSYYVANLDPANIGTALDSGYFLGTGILGLTNFAERYSNTSGGNDSMQVLGILAAIKGASATPSTHNVDFNVWAEGAPATLSTNLVNSGMPSTILKTMTVPYSGVGFNMYQSYWFPTPTNYIGDNYFVGISLGAYTYDATSMAGDTLSTLVSQNRVSPITTMSGSDTVINNQSVVGAGTTWLDLGFDIGITSNFYFFPIVNAKRDSLDIVSVAGGITNRNFTFAGSYPNPAVNYTNVVFEITNTTNVTISIMDVAGRTIKTINNEKMTAGKHTVKVETTDLAAGEYVYLIRTTEGGGIASKMTIIK